MLVRTSSTKRIALQYMFFIAVGIALATRPRRATMRQHKPLLRQGGSVLGSAIIAIGLAVGLSRTCRVMS